MRDSQHGGQEGRAGDALAALARSVVVQLKSRIGPAERLADESVVAAITRSLLGDYPDAMEALRQDLRRARISDTDLVDIYFPEVARYLGCAWAEDRTPFTDVSIAVARMQAMLRDIGRSWTSNAVADRAEATVLVVLPRGEQHSFGAMLLTGQLRRQGISVRLEVGTSDADLRRLAEARTFDCAMVSISCEEALSRCKAAVEALKLGSAGRLRVAVGGPLLERSLDICALTGADIATSDPMLALGGAFLRAEELNDGSGQALQGLGRQTL
jgi:MerR family transcriptional regulator, light-induced transcriptional regulator